jgi:hypothetical protein
MRAGSGQSGLTLFHLVWALVATAAIALEVVIPASTNRGDWVWPVGMLPFPLAGALILAQRPGNRVGRVLAVVGVASGVVFAGGWAAMTWFEAAWSPYLEALVSPAVVVMFWGLIALLFIFPTGMPVLGWPQRTFRFITAVALVIVPTMYVFRPGPLDISAGLTGVEARENPLGIGPEWFDYLLGPGFGLVVLGGVAGLISLVGRFRRSVGVERAQLKLFIFGGFTLLILFLLISPLVEEATTFEPLLSLPVIAGFWGLPAAVVAAVLRYRLFEIDRLVARTVTYVVVLGLLGAAYATLVLTSRAFLPADDPVAVAVSTLAAAMAFLPLVRWVQGVVDRRFFRSRYDAAVVVSRVAEDLDRSVDPEDITARTRTVILDVFSPEFVSIWIAKRPSRSGSDV